MKFTHNHLIAPEDAVPDMPAIYKRGGTLFRPDIAVLHIYAGEPQMWDVYIWGSVLTPKGNLHSSQRGWHCFNTWKSELPGARDGLLPDGRHVLTLFTQADIQALGTRMLTAIRDINTASEDMWREWRAFQ